jgi:hypothetical protein
MRAGYPLAFARGNRRPRWVGALNPYHFGISFAFAVPVPSFKKADRLVELAN